MLFSVIGIAWGYGNGSTTFNLPDFRGKFPRGVDKNSGGSASGYDPDSASRNALYAGGNTGNKVGTYQSDAIRNLVGSVTAFLARIGLINTGVFTNSTTYSGMALDHSGSTDPGVVINFNAASTVPTGSDNRPYNAACYFIIKY
jgi:microcystin-dependent protein